MFYQRLALCFVFVLLCSCGGQGSYSGPPAGTYTVNVMVSGLPNNNSATLSVQNNASTLSFTANGTQSFPYQTLGSAYSVSVLNQPSPLVCIVTSGSGVNSVSSTVTVNVSCATQYAYVTNYSTHKLAVVPIGQNGLLTQGSAQLYDTGGQPTAVVIHPNGQYAYVSNQLDNTISVYSISSGTLTQISTPGVGHAPYSIAISPNGAYFYSGNTDGTISEFTVNANGTLSQLASTVNNVAGLMSSITVDPTSSYVYATRSDATNNVYKVYEYQIQNDGSLVGVGAGSALTQSHPTSVVVHPSAKFAYVVNSGSGYVSVYPITSGVLGTPANIQVQPGNTSPQSIVFTPNGKFAYVTNYGQNGTGNTISQFQVDATTGSLQAMNPPNTNVNQLNVYGPIAIAVDATGYCVISSNYSSGTVSEYLISSSGIQANASQIYSGLSNPNGIAIH